MSNQSQRWDSAVAKALDNIKKCIELKKDFSDRSIANFKRNYNEEYQTLAPILGETRDPGKWIATLLIEAEDRGGDVIHKHKEVYNTLITKNSDLKARVDAEMAKIHDEMREADPNHEHESDPEPDPVQESESEYEDAEQPNDILTKILQKLTEEVKDLKSKESHSHLSRTEIRIENLKNASQNIFEWFTRFEIQTSRWTDKDRGLEVPCYFEDIALSKYQLINPQDRFNYQVIKKHMIEVFLPKDREISSRLDFYKATQRIDESVDQFGHRLLRLVEQTNKDMKEIYRADLPSIFKNGCNDEIRRGLIGQDTKNFDRLWEMAKELEQFKPSKSEIAAVNVPTESVEAINTSNIVCYNCKKKGHLSKDCKGKRIPMRNKTERKCFLCGMDNHYSTDCRKFEAKIKAAKTFNNPSNKPNFKSNKTKNIRNECKRCHKPGHSEEDCWTKNITCKKCNKRGHSAKDCCSRSNSLN